MTVINAAPAPTVEDVVGRIKDNVWILICAGEIPAALVLLRSQLADFERAWLPTYVAKAPLALPGPAVVTPAALALPGPATSAVALPEPDLVTPTAVQAGDEVVTTTDVVIAIPEPTPTKSLVHITETGAKVGVIRLPRLRTPRSRARKAS